VRVLTTSRCECWEKIARTDATNFLQRAPEAGDTGHNLEVKLGRPNNQRPATSPLIEPRLGLAPWT
jgi:hypothetical protein